MAEDGFAEGFVVAVVEEVEDEVFVEEAVFFTGGGFVEEALAGDGGEGFGFFAEEF